MQKSAKEFLLNSIDSKYSYNFNWCGIPIFQYPQDIVQVQELIWKIKPDLIIETGIAKGGSMILSASMMLLLDIEKTKKTNKAVDFSNPKRKVLGIDVDIRKENHERIISHPFYNYIQMIKGSSIDDKVTDEVRRVSKGYEKVLVLLDSNHTKEHVLKELEAYANLVSIGSYCVVFDTIIEDVTNRELFSDRPWHPGNSPKNAVDEFMSGNKMFKIDHKINEKLLVSVAPNGYLKRIK